MHEFRFEALGTTWVLSSDGEPFQERDIQKILSDTETFNTRFSRFQAGSEANAFREAQAGTYVISDDFASLLGEADRLRHLTHGAYDPAVGNLLERAGYDSEYSMRERKDVDAFTLPTWSLAGNNITVDGPVVFDLGGIGKGYWIDRIAGSLINKGYQHISVDGGGDIFVTTKKDGSAWRAAIQYPGKPDIAAGMVMLKNQALAVSDSFRRRWGRWHHIIDLGHKRPVEENIGAAAVAGSAYHADCMTSALFLSSHDRYPLIAEEYKAAYLAFRSDGTCLKSANWEGELF